MTEQLIIIGGPPQNTTFGVMGNQQVVDATFGAARVSLKPNEFINQAIAGGHFRAAAASGLLTGVGAAGVVFSARWSPPNGAAPYAIIKKISIGWILTTAFTAAQVIDFDVVRATAFTAPDTGGTALSPFSGNNNKKRSSLMSPSQWADMRIAATAALAAGTKTLDANPFAYLSSPVASTAGNTALQTGVQMTDVYIENSNSEHPEMFGANEGFNIRAVTAMGALGVVKLYVAVDWAEVPGL